MNSGHKILIIDDDPVWVKAATMILESEGYSVDSAQDGDEGLAKMEQRKPDLVLLDVMMKRPLEGISVSREIARQQKLRDIPIIMVTSVLDTEYSDAFLQSEHLPIASTLLKPCSPSRLLAEVERVLSLHERPESISRRGEWPED